MVALAVAGGDGEEEASEAVNCSCAALTCESTPLSSSSRRKLKALVSMHAWAAVGSFPYQRLYLLCVSSSSSLSVSRTEAVSDHGRPQAIEPQWKSPRCAALPLLQLLIDDFRAVDKCA